MEDRILNEFELKSKYVIKLGQMKPREKLEKALPPTLAEQLKIVFDFLGPVPQSILLTCYYNGIGEGYIIQKAGILVAPKEAHGTIVETITITILTSEDYHLKGTIYSIPK